MSELLHYGVLGMKWGVRKDRRPSGTGKIGFRKRPKLSKTKVILTEEEKKAREEERKAEKQRGKDLKDVVSGSRKLVDTTKDLYEKRQKEKAAKEVQRRLKDLNVEGMSDKDLRDIVNRMNLERQYKDLMSSQYSREVNTGSSTIKTILDSSGTALGVASTTLSIMLAIKSLRGG